jgi:ribonucleoside-diphosphate reductase alpha chain
MRFEPMGITDDPDIRFASSIMDYLFRRLSLEYLSYDERAELGIFSVDERMQPTLPGVEESSIVTATGIEVVSDPKSKVEVEELTLDLGQTPSTVLHADAPLCMQCGVQMVRAGSCHVCPSCGNTSGCS